MAARQGRRHQRHTRRAVAGVIGAALALAVPTIQAHAATPAATPTPSPTATTPPSGIIPAVGTQWAALMHASLTADQTAAALRTTLTGELSAVSTSAGALAAARSANADAANRATAAVTADTTARAQYTASASALASGKATLARLQKHSPVDKGAVARTQTFVSAATVTVTSRKAATVRTGAVLTSAKASVAADTAALSKASADWLASTAAVTATQQKIAAIGPSAAYADQASALGQSVVAQMRPAFTTADTTKVYGITVNKIISYPFQRLIDDAKAAGIVMSGGGFRTQQQQIALRTANGCPDIWTAPPSSCRVPTAIPGRSLHELGLAVDYTYAGKTLAKNTPAYIWMTQHAATYGFTNLPSEPWHWSITGN